MMISYIAQESITIKSVFICVLTGFLAGAKFSRGVHLRSASVDDEFFGCSFVLTGVSGLNNDTEASEQKSCWLCFYFNYISYKNNHEAHHFRISITFL